MEQQGRQKWQGAGNRLASILQQEQASSGGGKRKKRAAEEKEKKEPTPQASASAAKGAPAKAAFAEAMPVPTVPAEAAAAAAGESLRVRPWTVKRWRTVMVTFPAAPLAAAAGVQQDAATVAAALQETASAQKQQRRQPQHGQQQEQQQGDKGVSLTAMLHQALAAVQKMLAILDSVPGVASAVAGAEPAPELTAAAAAATALLPFSQQVQLEGEAAKSATEDEMLATKPASPVSEKQQESRAGQLSAEALALAE